MLLPKDLTQKSRNVAYFSFLNTERSKKWTSQVKSEPFAVEIILTDLLQYQVFCRVASVKVEEGIWNWKNFSITNGEIFYTYSFNPKIWFTQLTGSFLVNPINWFPFLETPIKWSLLLLTQPGRNLRETSHIGTSNRLTQLPKSVSNIWN